MAKGIGALIAIGRQAPPRYKATPDTASAPNGPSLPASSGKGGDPPKDPDAGRPEQDVTITPEAVSYHGADQMCGACSYYVEGQCKVLKMPVENGAWCKAFESKADDSDVPNVEETGEQAGQ